MITTDTETSTISPSKLSYYVKNEYKNERVWVFWNNEIQRWVGRVCINEEWEDMGLFHDPADARGACYDLWLSIFGPPPKKKRKNKN